MKKRFNGWYFKHQKGDEAVAFIPGCSESGAFVQVISNGGALYFPISDFHSDGKRIIADGCVFSTFGCKIDLPGVSGEIVYEDITPLRSDIMGPFRFFPMKCRHGVISMGHSLRGAVSVNGRLYNFDGGRGYIEKDSGTSFPSAYQWLQCNDFPKPCSVMISVAKVPFLAFDFTGCICAVFYNGIEYRLATYKGAKISSAMENTICLSQGRLKLTAEISTKDCGYSLKAPIDGQMTSRINERINAKIRLRLWERGKLLFDLCSSHATYEYVPSM